MLVNGATAPRLPTTTNISFSVDGQSLVVALDLKGATSTGSACSSGASNRRMCSSPWGLLTSGFRVRSGLVSARQYAGGGGRCLAMLPPTVARLRQYTRGSVRHDHDALHDTSGPMSLLMARHRLSILTAAGTLAWTGMPSTAIPLWLHPAPRREGKAERRRATWSPYP